MNLFDRQHDSRDQNKLQLHHQWGVQGSVPADGSQAFCKDTANEITCVLERLHEKAATHIWLSRCLSFCLIVFMSRPILLSILLPCINGQHKISYIFPR